MRVIVIQSSPNRDGLTAACAAAAAEGTRRAGAEVEDVRLNDLDVGLCRACDDGWGICRDQHRCTQQDDFNALHERVCAADAYVFVTPVYWGEASESAKAFLDRLRRCEARRGEESALAGKWAIAVAAAGGSGNGATHCLAELERLLFQVRARPFDLIGITRRSRAYTLACISGAAETMVTAQP